MLYLTQVKKRWLLLFSFVLGPDNWRQRQSGGGGWGDGVSQGSSVKVGRCHTYKVWEKVREFSNWSQDTPLECHWVL